MAGTGPKAKVTASVDPALYAWIAERTGPGQQFSSISHALERGLVALRDVERIPSLELEREALTRRLDEMRRERDDYAAEIVRRRRRG